MTLDATPVELAIAVPFNAAPVVGRELEFTEGERGVLEAEVEALLLLLALEIDDEPLLDFPGTLLPEVDADAGDELEGEVLTLPLLDREGTGGALSAFDNVGEETAFPPDEDATTVLETFVLELPLGVVDFIEDIDFAEDVELIVELLLELDVLLRRLILCQLPL